MGSAIVESAVFEIGDIERWTQHLAMRWAEASTILPLAADAALNPSSVQVILPSDDELRSTILQSDPLATLPGYLPGSDHPSPGWHRHVDLIDDVAHVLMDRLRGTGRVLRCEGGYSAIGDPHLASKRYVQYKGGVLYEFAFNTDATTEELAKVLRQGRSFRFLGCVVSGPDLATQSSSGLFICDFVGGDTCGLCEFYAPSV